MSIEITLSKNVINRSVVNFKKITKELHHKKEFLLSIYDYSHILKKYEAYQNTNIGQLIQDEAWDTIDKFQDIDTYDGVFLKYYMDFVTVHINNMPQLWLTKDECAALSVFLVYCQLYADDVDLRGWVGRLITLIDKTFIHNIVYDADKPLVNMIYERRKNYVHELQASRVQDMLDVDWDILNEGGYEP